MGLFDLANLEKPMQWKADSTHLLRVKKVGLMTVKMILKQKDSKLMT